GQRRVADDGEARHRRHDSRGGAAQPVRAHPLLRERGRPPRGLPITPLATRILEELRATPRHFAEVVDAHPDVAWRGLLRAWGEVRAAGVLGREEDGRYRIDPR